VTETVTTLALASPDTGAFEDGLALLAELTPRLTSEFAIRRFLIADLDRALQVVQTWTADPDETVRRLASEGTRSFLPWAIRVKPLLDAPSSTVPIINALYRDSSDVVRRSVANHLNDLSRQQPELTTRIAANWLANPDENTTWVVRHATRSLIKKGYPPALALLGFTPARITVAGFALDSHTVTAPGDLGFEFTVTNSDNTAITLAIDYVVDYRKSNGRSAPKVFKLTTRTLGPAETVSISKRHNFRPMTTRVHYAGEHTIRLQINGEQFAGGSFQLRV
jgi:3-methyladenine DNA glycosylase AlkC